MSCINDYIIQVYIDGEANSKETAKIESHIATCKKCALKIENQRRQANSIKAAIYKLAKDSNEITEFTIPGKQIKRRSFTIKGFSYFVAAASILLFVLFITQKNDRKKQNEIIMAMSPVTDIDANRPVTQIPLVINIVDSQGNISEYSIE